jgi:molybdate/tungstate transport system substrate-binding protein
MARQPRALARLAGLALATLLLASCVQPPAAAVPAARQERITLRVLMAGSLIQPFDDLEAAFEQIHPEVDVLMEGHGSIQVIRHVTELRELVDVVASADYALLPALMYQSTDPETGQPYADWTIQFATNRLTLAYTDRSLYADEINANNWSEVINRPGVRLGLPDPRFDAAGYRGLMLLQLAEDYYDAPQIFEDTLQGRLRRPIRTYYEDGRWTIVVPEIVQPVPNSGLIVRGSSVQLIALLESGDLDYAFEYESVSRQHGFNYLTLADELNMGSEALADTYDQVEVQLDFQRFQSVTPVFGGEFIAYGITVPSNAPHPQQAAELVAFLLGPEGQQIMAANYHPLITPPRVDYPERLPDVLRGLAVPKEE